MKQFFILLFFSLANAQANTLQDPTKPSPNKSMFNSGQDPSTMTPMALKLTAIINNNQNKQAIINGKSFAQGQQVQGYKVIFISQNHVLLEGSDGPQTLYVNNNNIKKDTNNGF
jgi:MSHA biogenesis protein MshK